jgi:hypothetical protein
MWSNGRLPCGRRQMPNDCPYPKFENKIWSSRSAKSGHILSNKTLDRTIEKLGGANLYKSLDDILYKSLDEQDIRSLIEHTNVFISIGTLKDLRGAYHKMHCAANL